jgi:hypothetical protein
MNEIWRPIAGREGTYKGEVEEWREIPGWEGRYEISSWGRCRSLDRVVTQGGRWGPVQRKLKGQLLQPASRGRYLSVGIAGRTMSVHRLVLLAFEGSPPSDKHQAAHWNGNSKDNRLDNLRWATASENDADKRRHGTKPLGEKSPNGQKLRCPYGHPYDEQNTIVTKLASGLTGRDCRACQQARQRKLMQDPAYRARKRKRLREQKRSRYRADPAYREKMNAQSRAYHAIKQQHDPAYREKAKERVREWLRDPENRAKKNAKERDRKRRARGTPPSRYRTPVEPRLSEALR